MQYLKVPSSISTASRFSTKAKCVFLSCKLVLSDVRIAAAAARSSGVVVHEAIAEMLSGDCVTCNEPELHIAN